MAGAGERWARLIEPLRYLTSRGRVFIVPPEFETDFASIPRLLWSLVGSPAGGRYRRAAVLHDYLYAHGAALWLKRSEADAVFREAMLVSGVTPAKARIIYYGVRIGGWITWRRYRKQEKQEERT